jgi:glutamyl-Q tRNA(Asp) synthetase
MQSGRGYRGRFAPSPTGPLHFGSLVTALASYLDAKHNQGKWLVRIEDIDVPRTIPGAAEDILQTLERFGLQSDEPVLYQSLRASHYEAALQTLKLSGAAYPCTCSRKEILQHEFESRIYRGRCRNGVKADRRARAWRIRTDHRTELTHPSLAGEHLIQYIDALQGSVQQYLEKEVGDFVVRRADGLIAYQLAVVVDDHLQGITHVVRGADLLTSTPRQIYLQQLLGYSTPVYMHLPLAVDAQGRKLSKQTLAAPVDSRQPVATLLRVLDFLRQNPPAELAGNGLIPVLEWAGSNWNKNQLHGIMRLPA